MTTRYFARLIQLVASLAAATAFAVSGGIAHVSAATNDVQMCHFTGNGGVHVISISASAEPAHRAHGDFSPGDTVPSDPSLVFDADCNQVAKQVPAATLSCPCWSTYTQSALVGLLTSGAGAQTCWANGSGVSVSNGTTRLYTSSLCQLTANGQTVVSGLTPVTMPICLAEATALLPSITWCP